MDYRTAKNKVLEKYPEASYKISWNEWQNEFEAIILKDDCIVKTATADTWVSALLKLL